MKDPVEVLSNIGNFSSTFSFLWWIVLPPFLYYIFGILWLDYVIAYSKKSWIGSLTWIVLEIIPPREIEKGPKLMESFFQGLSGTLGSISAFDELLKGKIDDSFSLELVSDEGQVHFYVRAQTKYRTLVEANIYAQYPEAQVIEVEDYVKKFPKVIPNKKWDLWGADFVLNKPDIYPIKTYDRFEESVTGEMIDPLGALMEIMGAMGPGQHLWLQYVVVPLREDWRDKDAQKAILEKLTGREKPKEKSFLDHFMDIFSNLFKAMLGPVEFAKSEKKDEAPLEFRLSPMEKEVLKAVEENSGRLFFRVKMRLVLLGIRQTFDRTNIGVFIGGIKQFNDLNLNSFRPEAVSKTYGAYLGGEKRNAFRQRKIYGRYKRRNMDDANIVLSSKEMATLFHFPDSGVKSPSVPRVDAKRSTPPPNLPIG